MKKFLKTIFKFAGLVFLILFILSILTLSIEKTDDNFTIEKNIKYLVLGHSQPECAFNDSLISNFKNISQSAEPYFYTYIKLRKLIEINENIDTIFVEFSNNQIEIVMDTWIWDKEYFSYRYPKYSIVMNLSEKYYVSKKNLIHFFNTFSITLKDNLLFLIKREKDYIKYKNWGGYVDIQKSNIDSLLNTNSSMPKSYIPEISKNNLYWLNKIIESNEDIGFFIKNYFENK